MMVRGRRWGIIDIDDVCGRVGVHDAIVFTVAVALAISDVGAVAVSAVS